MFNLTADLAKNLQVYQRFTESRSSVIYPAKMDVPMVWDLYMDTARPVSGGAEKSTASLETPSGRNAVSGGIEPRIDGTGNRTSGRMEDTTGRMGDQTSGGGAPFDTASFAQTVAEAGFPETYRFASGGAAAPISFLPEEFDSGNTAPVTYRSPVSGDLDLLGLVNDRLKTQARRYPHPITNELEDFH